MGLIFGNNMIYTIEPTVKHPDALVNIADSKGRIVNFFINNIGDSKFLEYSKIQVNAKEGYNKNNILKTDFFGSALGIPIFSQRGKDLLEEKLGAEIIFYECDLLFNGGITNCFAGKITKNVSLISEENSRFRVSSSGSNFLVKPIINEDVNENFFIAKDIKYPTYFYASESLKKIIDEYDLNVILK